MQQRRLVGAPKAEGADASGGRGLERQRHVDGGDGAERADPREQRVGLGLVQVGRDSVALQHQRGWPWGTDWLVAWLLVVVTFFKAVVAIVKT
jgi:hypothetical protein